MIKQYQKENDDKKLIDDKDTQADDKYDKLKKLKSLLDDGVITQDEFDNEKKKLLE